MLHAKLEGKKKDHLILNVDRRETGVKENEGKKTQCSVFLLDGRL